MKRDLSRLASNEFDLLVIGGGIHGLAAAYDAAQRGLSVALIERGDFGAATSFNHLKTLHGGLRYLQAADIGRMRESIRERRAFARIAPAFVAPVAFVMPTSPTLTRNPMAMRAAFLIDAAIAADRNAGLDASHRLKAGRVFPATKCQELFEGVARTRGASGAVWFDYETVEGDRLTLAFGIAAAGHGAALANYVEAARASIGHVTAVDVLTGQTFDIRARVVLNATGPWASTLLSRIRVTRQWPLLKAMNLVTSRPARKVALVHSTRAGRGLVLLPWRGRMLVGTSESPGEHQPDDQAARRAEVAAFLTEVNETFGDLNLRSDEVTLVHRGVVPAAHQSGRLTLLGQSRVIDHATDGRPEWISIVGVKYTTARAVAEHAIDLVLIKLGRRHIPSRTAEVTLPGGAAGDKRGADPIRTAIESEMALTLVDVVVRRTGLGASGYPGDEVATETAGAMKRALGWTPQRVSAEISSLKRFYEIKS